MGSFDAGKWLIGLSLYFFVFFVISFSIVNLSIEYTGSSDITVSDIGYNSGVGSINNGSVTADSYDSSSVIDTVKFMSGFSNSIDLDLPDFSWVFNFLFFWIPSFMLLWAIYMSLPIIH